MTRMTLGSVLAVICH